MYPHSQMFVTATAQRNDPDSAGSSATPDLSRPLRLTREHYRRVINLRRELERMRVSIDRVMTGLSTLNVAVPDTRGAVEQLTRLNVRLSRYQEAPLEEMPTAFESPIAGLFSRAYERHRQVQADREVAGQLEAETAELGRRGTHERSTARSVRIREEMRRAVAGVEARLAIDDVLENGTGAAGEATDSAGHQVWTPAASDLLPSLPNYLDSVNPDITPEMLQATTSWPAHPESASRAAHMIEHTGYESEDEDSQVTSEDDDDDEDYYDDYERENNGNDRESNDGHVKGRGLDKPDTDRPAAIEDEEGFKIDARCDICMGQIASMATFPCGHMVMCKWCAEIQMPTLSHARNVPRDRLSKCPVCRRKVKFIVSPWHPFSLYFLLYFTSCVGQGVGAVPGRVADMFGECSTTSTCGPLQTRPGRRSSTITGMRRPSLSKWSRCQV